MWAVDLAGRVGGLQLRPPKGLRHSGSVLHLRATAQGPSVSPNLEGSDLRPPSKGSSLQVSGCDWPWATEAPCRSCSLRSPAGQHRSVLRGHPESVWTAWQSDWLWNSISERLWGLGSAESNTSSLDDKRENCCPRRGQGHCLHGLVLPTRHCTPRSPELAGRRWRTRAWPRPRGLSS